MRFWVRSAIGVGLFVASVLVFNLKLVALLNTGTCASGNQPYVIARECPDGTGTDVLLLVLSIFGLFISAGFFVARGDPPNGRRPTGFPWILAWWGIFFGVTGAVALIYALTSDTAPPDAELGGAIVGVTFLVMGLPALWFAATTYADHRRRRARLDGD